MNEFAQKCIEKIYYRKDYQCFIERSKRTPIYLGSLLDLVKSECEKINICNLANEPAIEIWCDFKKYKMCIRDRLLRLR